MRRLYFANIDALRYGTGLVHYDNGQFRVIEPDKWFMAVDEMGVPIGDVVVDYYSTAANELPNSGMVQGQREVNSRGYITNDVVRVMKDNYREGTRSTEWYRVDGGTLSDQLQSPVVTAITGRQTAPIFHGYVVDYMGTSVFDDMRPIVRSLISAQTALVEEH